MKRYELNLDMVGSTLLGGGMEEDPQGEWVKADEAMAVERERDDLSRKLGIISQQWDAMVGKEEPADYAPFAIERIARAIYLESPESTPVANGLSIHVPWDYAQDRARYRCMAAAALRASGQKP